MKKLMVAMMASAMALAAAHAMAADKVTLQLKWVTQSQFAGYYVAKEKGYLRGRGPRRRHQAGRSGHRTRTGRSPAAAPM